MLLYMLQGQKIKSKVSWRDYYNKIYEEVNKKHRSTGLYADTTNLHINRIEDLWRASWHLLTLTLVQVLQGGRY